jgi:hypothetical protein
MHEALDIDENKNLLHSLPVNHEMNLLSIVIFYDWIIFVK